jgi:tetratricopeptide (TPR) repeat protein
MIIKKKCLWVIFILFQKLNLNAQSCKILNEATVKLFYEGKIEDAIKNGDNACKSCQLLGLENLDYETSLYNLAFIYESLKDYKIGELLYLKALPISEKLLGKYNLQYVKRLKNFANFYYHMGNKEKVIQLLIDALEITKKLSGEDNLDYSKDLNTLAGLYESFGFYKKAEPIYLEIIKIRKKILGEAHPDYLVSLSNIASLYQKIGDFQKSESINLQVLAMRKKVLGEGHLDYATSLNNLGGFYKFKGDYQKSESMYIEAITIFKKNQDNEPLAYATLLNNLAGLYDNLGDYKKAEPMYIESYNIREKILGKEHFDCASSLNNLGCLYSNLGDYKKAELYLYNALKIRKKVLGEVHPDYASSLNNLASLYNDNGNYKKAELLYLESLKINKSVFGENHPNYTTSLVNLANIYKFIGDFKNAELIYIKAIRINKIAFGEKHPNYVRSLNDFAGLMVDLGNYKKAEENYLKVIEINKKVLGDSHLDYATSVNNLGVLYDITGENLKAETFYMEAFLIRKVKLGETHPDYAVSLNNLGSIYLKLGYFEKSGEMLLKALEMRRKILGVNHPNYFISINNLASYYEKIGNTHKAESYYMECLKDREKILGIDHPDYLHSVSNIAFFYTTTGDFKNAERYILNQYQIACKNQKYLMSFSSFKNVEKYFESNLFYHNSWLSTLINYQPSSIKDSLINFNYFIKGALLQNNIRLSESVKNSKDTSVLNKWEEYKNIKSQITKLNELPLAKQDELQTVKDDAEKLEKELMQVLPAFQEQTINNNIKWQQVQAKLKDNEAAIEFVHFQYYNKRWTDTTFYAAYIVKKGIKHPIFINCFQEKDLIAILEKSKLKTDINNLYQGIDNKLYQLIWQPLDSVLQNINTVYVSPSGLLNRISFGAITAPSNKKLLEQYQIHIMNNTRAIAELKPNLPAIASIALLGDIDYDNEPSTIHNNNSEIATIDDSTLVTLRNNMGSKWQYLFGTKKEIESVKLITIGSNINITLYGGSNASEDLVKAMGTGKQTVPNIIHFATHGFAMPNPQVKNTKREFDFSDDKNKFKYAIDPLSRTGIILSGANKVWTTNNTFANKEDGILTASEIADLNLSNCQLAVLSACETGLGDVQGSEGVYGLQRAFKMAGVRYIINSLWQIPDAETSEFMQLFYTNYLQNKMEIHKAFTETQLAMSVKYEPYKWAAFVLVE